MPQLFGANCTPQQMDFQYRVPENGRNLSQLIPSGFNRPIGDRNLSTPAIDAIIARNAKYGMVEFKDLEKAMRDGIQVTVVFRRDDTVPPEVIRDVIARNRKDLTIVGKKRREDLAVAAARVMDPENPEQSDHVSVSIEEIEPGTMSKESGSPTAEGYVGPDNILVKQGMIKGGSRSRRGR